MLDADKADGFGKVYVDGENLVFLADGTLSLKALVEMFIEYSATTDNGYVPVFSFLGDINKTQSITVSNALTGTNNSYTYVWGDDFNDSMDDTVTTYGSDNWIAGVQHMQASASAVDGVTTSLSSGTDAIFIKNGAMTLKNYGRNVQIADRKYSLGQSKWYDYTFSGEYVMPNNLSTTNKMNWRYGYMEIRAKVPMMQSVWPSFWTMSVKGEADVGRTPPYIGGVTGPMSSTFRPEYDIFEVFGSSKFEVTIHKHYKNSSGKADPAVCASGSPKVVDATEFTNNFHTFGFEWTPQDVSMYIDGVAYATFPIDANNEAFFTQEKLDEILVANGFAAGTFDIDDITGFHDPQQLMFNNHFFIDSTDDSTRNAGCIEYSESYNLSDANTVKADPSSEYVIDYVRLYQDPNMNDGGATYGSGNVLYSGLWTN